MKSSYNWTSIKSWSTIELFWGWVFNYFETECLIILNWVIVINELSFQIVRGRFGIVRRCIQKCSGQELVAKLMGKRMVRREAVEVEFNTLHSLQHPNIVRVYDLYETPNANIIIMQLWVWQSFFLFSFTDNLRV